MKSLFSTIRPCLGQKGKLISSTSFIHIPICEGALAKWIGKEDTANFIRKKVNDLLKKFNL